MSNGWARDKAADPPRLRVDGAPAALGLVHELAWIDFVCIQPATEEQPGLYGAPGGRELTSLEIRGWAARHGLACHLVMPRATPWYRSSRQQAVAA